MSNELSNLRKAICNRYRYYDGFVPRSNITLPDLLELLDDVEKLENEQADECIDALFYKDIP